MESFRFFDLPNELQHKIWSCLDDKKDINEKMLLGLYFVDGHSEKENSQERWIKKHIDEYCEYDDWTVTCVDYNESFTRTDYTLLFYKFRSAIGKNFQKEFNLDIPDRLISKFKEKFNPMDIESAGYLPSITSGCKQCEHDYGVMVFCEECLGRVVARALKLYDTWVAWDPAQELYDHLDRKLKEIFFDFLKTIENLRSCDVTDFVRAFIRQADKVKADVYSKINKS